MSLERPDFLSRDAGGLLADMILQYEQIAGRTLYPAQAERLVIDLIAYREILIRSAVQDAGEQNLITYARDGMLDQLGEMVGAARLGGAPARVMLRFELAAAAASAVLIPAGTRVTTGIGGRVFATETEATVAVGATFVEVWALSADLDPAANGLPIGQSFAAVDAVPGATVTAASVSFGGAGTESDERLRQRVRLAAARQSVGSAAHWRYHALTAHIALIDVAITTPEPGVVVVSGLTLDGQTDDAIEQAMRVALNDPAVRPLTDEVQVVRATPVTYAIDVHVTLLRDTNAAVVQTEALRRLNDYATGRRQRLGRDIVGADLVARVQAIPGVYQTTVFAPAAPAVVIAPHQFPVATSVQATIDGDADG